MMTCSFYFLLCWSPTLNLIHSQKSLWRVGINYKKELMNQSKLWCSQDTRQLYSLINPLRKLHGPPYDIVYNKILHQQHMFSLFQIAAHFHKKPPPIDSKPSSIWSQPQSVNVPAYPSLGCLGYYSTSKLESNSGSKATCCGSVLLNHHCEQRIRVQLHVPHLAHALSPVHTTDSRLEVIPDLVQLNLLQTVGVLATTHGDALDGSALTGDRHSAREKSKRWEGFLPCEVWCSEV